MQMFMHFINAIILKQTIYWFVDNMNPVDLQSVLAITIEHINYHS